MRYFIDIILPESEAVAELSKEPSALPYILGIAVGAAAIILIAKAIRNKK